MVELTTIDAISIYVEALGCNLEGAEKAWQQYTQLCDKEGKKYEVNNDILEAISNTITTDEQLDTLFKVSRPLFNQWLQYQFKNGKMIFNRIENDKGNNYSTIQNVSRQ